MNLFDMLEAIDRFAKHNKNRDPAAVTLDIEVEDIYHQIESGRALRPSSVRWIQATYQALKEML